MLLLIWGLAPAGPGTAAAKPADIAGPVAQPLSTVTWQPTVIVGGNSLADMAPAVHPTDPLRALVGGLTPTLYTTDGGASWHNAAGLGGLNQGVPAWVPGGDGQSALQVSLSQVSPQANLTPGPTGNGLNFARSTDSGVHWSPPVTMTFPGLAENLPHLWADANPSSPYYGRMYLTLTMLDAGRAGTFDTVALLHSTDQGATWSTPVGLVDPTEFSRRSNYNAFTSAAVQPSGAVVVAWHRGQCCQTITNVPNKVMWSRSTDGGATFPVSGTIATVPVSQSLEYNSMAPSTALFRWTPAPNIATDPVDGTLYAVWVAFRQPNTPMSAAVYMSRSTDNGASWSSPVIVDNGGSYIYQYLPWVQVSPDHVVHVTYQGAIQADLMAHYYVQSTDRGATWSTPFQLAGPSYSYLGQGEFQGTSLGGYNGSQGTILTGWEELDADEIRQGTFPLPGSTPSPTPAATATCSPGWTIYPNPAPPGDSTLNGATALSANDLWAVGAFTSSGTITATTLTVHGNGTSWTQVQSPNPSSNRVALQGVAGVASNDAWAVGWYWDNARMHFLTLTEHWNGTAWSIVPSPNYVYNNRLYAVTAIASNDVWAVGITGSGSFPHDYALIEHWDGTSWSLVPNPGIDTTGTPLYGVAAVSANDVWAVGGGYTTYPVYARAYIEHWDGTAWSTVANPANFGTSLHAVTVVAANDIWAVGDSGAQTLIEHWDGTAWSIVASPNPGATINTLYGVSARAANDVWAAGSSNQASGGVKTFALHWDGTSWSQVPTPDNPTGRDQFYAIVASRGTSGEVWGMGTRGCSSGCTQDVLIARYSPPCPIYTPTSIASTPSRTATSAASSTASPTCTTAATPGPWSLRANYPQALGGVAVASDGSNIYGFAGWDYGWFAQAYKYNYATNSWTAIANVTNAVGIGAAEYGQNGKIYVLGGGSSPGPSPNQVYDITSNSWSPGAPLPDHMSGFASAYWNGKIYLIGGTATSGITNAVYVYDIAANSWSTLAPLPQAEYDMASTAINGKIYVANGDTGSSVTNNLYIYDIATNVWSSGPPSPLASYLAGSTAIAGKLYMVGGDPQGGGGHTSNTYLYDPATNSWSQGPNLNVSRSGGYAATINTPSGQTAIVVGGYGAGTSYLNSVEASSVPLVPCATATSATATSTPLPGTPTNTRTATRTGTAMPPTLTSTGTAPASTVTVVPTVASPTGTPCTIQFSDVPQGSPFYSYIRCLACRGIISGYNDGTYRPLNNITRGQISKMVSNAANFNDPVPSNEQTYEDVPPSNTFWIWIERLTLHGAISGYQCGGQGEPCVPPEGRPYFRVYNNATRAQLSKIVAIAYGGYPPPMAQMFEDVPPANPFYQWIEQLAEAGVISGYQCGGEGEPCIPPEGRPYFRPYSNVTRGQAAKIVSNTFYPNCQTPARREWLK